MTAMLAQRFAVKETIDHSLSDDDTNISLFYAFLPDVVQRSVPKVRSLRRSLGNYRSFGVHSRNTSFDSGSGSLTPPPAYHEALAPLTSALAVSDDDDSSVEEASTPIAHGKRTSFVEDEQNGIQWKYASQGLSLYNLAAQESTSPSADANFSRHLYVDAATYLLRGLPEDLNEEELIRLRAATPNILVQPQAPVGQLIVRDEGVQDMQRHPQETEDYEPTVIHRVVSMAVLQFFVVFSFLWPYIQVFASKTYEYERHHHISERFATSTWTTANAIGKQTLATANVVCTWNDGQVGETLESMFAWWIQGIAGGLCEGLGEGMEVLGVKPTRAQRRKGSAAKSYRA